MKNNIREIFLFAALGFFFGCATQAPAQTEGQITGGYQKVEVTAPQIVSAANFAVKSRAKKQKAKIKLVAIKKAEQQVVAGMNYNMCLQVETRERGGKKAVPQTVQAVVFLDIKQKYELSLWEIAACADDKSSKSPFK